MYKQNQEACDAGMIYEYTFKEQSFQVKVISDTKTTKIPYKYDSVKKVLAYENRYEIRLPDNQILFIYKSGFENAKMEEFFLKNLQKNKKKVRIKGGNIMLHIGLCEDDNDLRKYYHSFLTEWASSENIPAYVSSYESSEQLLFSYDEKEPFDILILDIQMGGINGMELAKQLRKQDSHVQIIFLTGLKDYALEGYEVGAYRLSLIHI